MKNEVLSIYEAHRALCYKEGRGVLELKLKGPGDTDFASFCDYYQRHYKPLLEQLAKDKPDTAARFIVEDLDAIFLGYLREWEND